MKHRMPPIRETAAIPHPTPVPAAAPMLRPVLAIEVDAEDEAVAEGAPDWDVEEEEYKALDVTEEYLMKVDWRVGGR